MRDAPKDAEGLLEHVLDEVMAGIDRADDIAILAARFLPVAPRPLDLTVASREDSSPSRARRGSNVARGD